MSRTVQIKVTKTVPVKILRTVEVNVDQEVEVEVIIEAADLTDADLLQEMEERGLSPDCDEAHVSSYNGAGLLDLARDVGVAMPELLAETMHPPHILEAIEDMRRGVTQGTIKVTPRIQELFLKVFEAYI